MIMSPRVDVLEEIRLNYEMPYLTSKGEAIDALTVSINEHRQGVDISYALVDCTEEHLSSVFPSGGIDSLARMTKQVLHDLGVKPRRIILHLWEYSPVAGPYTVEGRAPVNKERDTVLIIVTKPPFVYKFGQELLLWHQAMHAKDRWEYRFPAAHPMVNAGAWLDALWHFSIDGRLQSWAKPHYSKAERLEEATDVLHKLCPRSDLQAVVSDLCDRLWGKEVTFSQLIDIGKGIGLEPALAPGLESLDKHRAGQPSQAGP